MTAARIVLLLVAGAVAGIVGSAGGTASLIAYPALLAAGGAVACEYHDLCGLRGRLAGLGARFPALVRALGHAGRWPAAALAVTGTLIAIRTAWVFVMSAVSGRRGGSRPAWPAAAVVSWAGTRGVVPLAAALSIPLTTAGGAVLAQRDLVLVLAAAAIVVSLLVQGFTLEPLARLAGFGRAGPADPRREETVARLRLAEAGLARLDELAGQDAAPDAVTGPIRAGLQARIETAPAWTPARKPPAKR